MEQCLTPPLKKLFCEFSLVLNLEPKFFLSIKMRTIGSLKKMAQDIFVLDLGKGCNGQVKVAKLLGLTVIFATDNECGY